LSRFRGGANEIEGRVFGSVCRLRGAEWRVRRELRPAVTGIIDHRDSNGLAEFLSLQDYLAAGIISEEEFELFRQHRESLTEPCDTEPEYRITWRGGNLDFGSTDTPIRFVASRCFRLVAQ
jgi:hypothetical protein